MSDFEEGVYLDEWENEPEVRQRIPRRKNCKFCGKRNLHWEDTPEGWALFDKNMRRHICGEDYLPKDRQVMLGPKLVEVHQECTKQFTYKESNMKTGNIVVPRGLSTGVVKGWHVVIDDIILDIVLEDGTKVQAKYIGATTPRKRNHKVEG